jgi:predicted acylesterase/phospholipase RssA
LKVRYFGIFEFIAASAAKLQKIAGMSGSAKSALVFQGGGALGAYELGAARALYRDALFSRYLIAGVSIGAITAVLLARPRRA